MKTKRRLLSCAAALVILAGCNKPADSGAPVNQAAPGPVFQEARLNVELEQLRALRAGGPLFTLALVTAPARPPPTTWPRLDRCGSPGEVRENRGYSAYARDGGDETQGARAVREGADAADAALHLTVQSLEAIRRAQPLPVRLGEGEELRRGGEALLIPSARPVRVPFSRSIC